MKKILLPLLALGALVVLNGCATSPTAAVPPQNAATSDLENNATFVLLGPALQHSITCSGIQQKVQPEGGMALAANVRNLENRRLEVQINCEFKDEQGFTIDSTPWTTLILTENAQETVPFESKNAQVKKYTIRVREAH